MELLLLSLIFSFVARNIVALPSQPSERKKREEFDNYDAESFLHTLATLPLDNNVPQELFDVAALPHESLHEFSSYAAPATAYGPPAQTYGVPAQTYGVPVPAPPAVGVVGPSVGVGINIDKHAVLAPHVEVFRFLEAFVQFKTELLSRLQHLINDNWDLILSIINLVLSKVQKLQGFLLVLISVLRQILEFATSLIARFSLNLPSVSVGVSGHVDPLPSFNIGSLISAASGWLNG